jgi:hypothetical protein
MLSLSCQEKQLSAICIPNVSIRNDSITLMALLNPHLPPGANLSGDFSSSAMYVVYRNRRYDVTTRQSGRDARFDVKPPIPLEHETTGVSGFRRGRELDVTQVLLDYWMYFAVVALAVIAYGFTRKRRREAEHDEVDL